MEPALMAGEIVLFRTQCGVQLLQNPQCTAGSEEAGHVRPATGTQTELFKTHYPHCRSLLAMFETSPPIPKTLLLVRNPIDNFLATQRHVKTSDPNKVGYSMMADSMAELLLTR